MAKTKSYFAKANHGKAGSVFVNNVIAASQKSSKDAEKRNAARQRSEASASRKRSALLERHRIQDERDRKRALDKENKDRERERKKESSRLQKEKEKEQKLREKLDSKKQKLADRVAFELDHLGIFPADMVCSRIANEAEKNTITIGQINKYFIQGNEEELSNECAIELLEIPQKYHKEHRLSKDYDDLLETASNLRPQTKKELSKLKLYLSLQDEIKKEIKEEEEEIRRLIEEERKAKNRHDGRRKLIARLKNDMSMFDDDIEEFKEIINMNDWSLEVSEKSVEYIEKLEKKSEYVKSIKSRIKPFKLGEYKTST